MKSNCPNPKQNPNCNGTSNKTRLCRSCSKYKGIIIIECIICKQAFTYKRGYSKTYCSRKCYNVDPEVQNRRYMQLKVMQTPECRAKRVATRKAWSEERKQQYKERRKQEVLSRNSEYLQKKSRSITDKILSGEFIPHGTHKKGHYLTRNGKDEVYHSLWELARMIELDEENVAWTKKHNIKIPYFYNNLNRLYIPDFLIGNVVEKVKPACLLTKYGNKEKTVAATCWCEARKLSYRTNSNVSAEYLEKAKAYHGKDRT